MVWINELARDAGIELAGTAGTDVAGMTLEVYEAVGASPTACTPVSGAEGLITVAAETVIGSNGVVQVATSYKEFSVAAIALVDSGTVLHFVWLSSSSALPASGGSADGLTPETTGVGFQSGGNTWQLTGGPGSERSAFTWTGGPASMGEVNAGQTIGSTEPPADNPGQRIADFLGQGDNTALVALAGEHAAIVTSMVSAYTRGQGFDETGVPNDELAAVITTATARMVANPEQIPYDTGTVSMRGGFQGWSLAETFVLNRFRKRAL